MDALRTLLASYLFQDLTPAELESLAARARHRDLNAGEYAFRNRDPAAELFIAQSGQLAETLIAADGSELVVEIFTAGDVFGEPALFVPERTRMADVRAMESSRVLMIDRELLVQFLFKHRRAMLRMLEGLASGFRTQAEATVHLAFEEIRQRLVIKLLELAETHGQPCLGGLRIEFDLSQATLAGMVGATRENVNRALAPLIATGDVRSEKKRFVVNADALRRYLATAEPPLHRRNRGELATPKQ
ncbi:MAG: Crp/Fnr family transcriptional regulator [Candidatus Dormiibacterota bacterium]